MAFPTTPILDTFTGTNGDDLPVYSANWSGITGASNLEIQGNAATGTAGANANYWNVASYGTDCEIYCTILVKPTDTTAVQLLLRAKDETALATIDGYFLSVVPAVGTDQITIRRLDNGVGTQLGAAISQEITNGDSVGLQVIGANLQAYYKPSGGSWGPLDVPRVDATYPLAGKLAMITTDTVVRIDDFGGGSISNVMLRSEWFAFG